MRNRTLGLGTLPDVLVRRRLDGGARQNRSNAYLPVVKRVTAFGPGSTASLPATGKSTS